MPVAEILSQGEEVLCGQTPDTNAAWLSARLTQFGFSVGRHTVLGDRLDDIRAVLTEIAPRVDLCVCTGGLGPTRDDLTAEAAAQAFGRPLELDPDALVRIAAFYEKRGRSMPSSNEKQAWLPHGALRLDNEWGTAPGFAFVEAEALLVFLPGVPEEMRRLFTLRVEPLLGVHFSLQPHRRITLRTTGLGESALQERLAAHARAGVELGFRACPAEVQVKLLFEHQVSDPEVRAAVDEVTELIGDAVFAVEGLGEQGGGLAEVVGRLLIQRGETLALAESCTGGLLASLCTRIPGASEWFLEGAVTYSNEAKIRALGVERDLLERYGAVSAPVARAMASGIRARSDASYGLSITGVAGPGGGTASKPVGTVHIALATPKGERHRLLRLGGERRRIQIDSAVAGLDLLRRSLTGRLYGRAAPAQSSPP
jgi:nicotinamide-nucleotide amidase